MPLAIAKWIRCAGLGLVCAAAVGCSDTPPPAQCEKLLDHLVELQLQEAGQSKEMPPAMKDALKKQKKEVAAYVREKFIAQCTEELPAAFVECALGARTTAEYADCSKQ